MEACNDMYDEDLDAEWEEVEDLDDDDNFDDGDVSVYKADPTTPPVKTVLGRDDPNRFTP